MVVQCDLEEVPVAAMLGTIMGDERKIASFEEIVYSNMLMLEALVGELSDKGAIDRDNIIRRIQDLRKQVGVFPKIDAPDQITLSRSDLVGANSIMAELLVDLLVDKGLLTSEELEEVLSKLKAKTKDLLRRQ